MGRYRSVLLILALLVPWSYAQPAKTTVTSVRPRKGSLMGGSFLWIEGNELTPESRDALESTSTVVYIGTTPCDIVEYDHTPNQIKCETRPRLDENGVLEPKNNIEIQVHIITPIYASQIVTSAKYNYEWGQTPTITSMTSATTAGSEFKIEGSLKLSNIDHHQIWIGGKRCETPDAEEGVSYNQRVTCTVYEELPCGRHSIVHKAQNIEEDWSGYGRAYAEPYAAQYDVATGESWHVTVYPSVREVTPDTTGQNGGDIVHINGTSFPESMDGLGPEDVNVTLAGIPCDVLTVEPEMITCKARAKQDVATSDPWKMGPRGVPRRRYSWYKVGNSRIAREDVFNPDHANDDQQKPYPNSPIMEDVTQTSVSFYKNAGGEDDNYGEEMVMYFIPPVSGKYVFYATADDQATLEMYSGGQWQAPIINIESATSPDWYYWKAAGQISAEQDLVAETPYLMRARVWEWTGVSRFRLAARIKAVDGLDQPAKQLLRQYHSMTAVVMLHIIHDEVADPTLKYRYGFIKLHVGETIVPIYGNVTSSQFRNAIQNAGIPVDRYWGWSDGPDVYRVVQFGVPGKVGDGVIPTITASEDTEKGGLTRGNCSLASPPVMVVEQGDPKDVFLSPIPADFFRAAVPPDYNQVDVEVTGMVAAHQKDDSAYGHTFTYDTSRTPEVTAIDKTDVKMGDQLTITIRNIANAVAEDVTVMIGKAPCEVDSVDAADPGTITCTVGAGEFGSNIPLEVLVKSRGIATLGSGYPAGGMGYLQWITADASPVDGSEAGGLPITITGSGFKAALEENVVKVGSELCTITAASYTSITCLTPEGTGGAVVKVNEGADGLPASSGIEAFNFTYSDLKTPEIDTIEVGNGSDPLIVPASVSRSITITGEKFGEPGTTYDILDEADKNREPPMTVFFGNRPCRILQINIDTNPDTVLCRLKRVHPEPDVPVTEVPPTLTVTDWGKAKIRGTDANTQLNMTYKITKVNNGVMPSGGLYGGTQIEIDGEGFALDPLTADYNVYLWFDYTHEGFEETKEKQAEIKLDCKVTEATATRIECVTPSLCDFAWPVREEYTNAEEAAQEICTKNLEVTGYINLTVNSVQPLCEDSGSNCMFKYTAKQTNTLTSMSHTTGKSGTEVTFTAQLADTAESKATTGDTARLLLGNHATDSHVESELCDVTSISGSTLTAKCTIPEYPASQLPVTLWIKGDGYAKDATNVAAEGFLNQLILTEVKPRRSSMEGGRVITLIGEGFSPQADQNEVKILDPSNNDNEWGDCTPIEASHTRLKCMTSKKPDTVGNDKFQLADIKVRVLGQDETLFTTDTSSRRRRLTPKTEISLHPSDRIRRRLRAHGKGGVASRFSLHKKELSYHRHHDVDIALGGGTHHNTHRTKGDAEAAAWTSHAVRLLRQEREISGADSRRRLSAPRGDAGNATIHTEPDDIVVTMIRDWAKEDVGSHRRRRLQTVVWPDDLIAKSSKCETRCNCQVAYIDTGITPKVLQDGNNPNVDNNKVTIESGFKKGQTLEIKGMGTDHTFKTFFEEKDVQPPLVTDSCSLTDDDTQEVPESDKRKVVIGGKECAITDWQSADATSIKCTLGDTPAGTHWVEVYVGGKGLAASFQITFELAVTGVTSDGSGPGSVAGGQLITFAGRGFSDIPNDNRITVCGLPCAVEDGPVYGQATCRTPPVLTEADIGQLADRNVVLPLEIFPHEATLSSLDETANKEYDKSRIFDNDPETAGTIDHGADSGDRCYVGIDMGEKVKGYLTNLAFFPPATHHERNFFKLGEFQWSNDGSTWTTFMRLADARPNEGWNEFTAREFKVEETDELGTPVTARYFRYWGATHRCYIHDIKFEGHVVVATAAGGECPTHVQIKPKPTFITKPPTPSNAVADASYVVAYSWANTPLISSIGKETDNSKYGSSLGNDTVSIKGTGLNPGTEPPERIVKFNGVECEVTTATETEWKCTTGRRDTSTMQTFSVDVKVPGRGNAMVENTETVYFRYLDRWSDVNTWKDFEEPAEDDFVIIPDGQCVLLDVSPPKLEMLLIHGMLVWDRKDLKLESTYIWIHGGIWELGTQAEPFEQNAEIVLHGDKFDTIAMPHVGNKMLAVSPSSTVGRMGLMDIHGKVRKRVWTFLAETALKDDTEITLKTEVDWAEDEEIFITSCTSSLGQIEVHKVASSAGNIVTLQTPLKHDHIVTTVTQAKLDEWNVDIVKDHEPATLTCEAGLMTRNIKIHGDENSPKQKYGVHTMAAVGALQRFENAELYHCGQQGNLGRYCSHFHLSSILHDGYIKANSVHHSFQRGTTIHGVWYAKITDNCYYDVAGHTVFVEDGAEKYNRIEGNLVALTRKNPVMLKGDLKPASFWQQIPSNYWRHNVAAGSVSWGFWFELTGRPTGPSATMDLCPIKEHVGQYKNNSAHSNSIGLRIYPGWNPMADPCGGSVTKPQYLDTLLSYRNGRGVFHKEVGDAHHHGYRLFENGLGVEWEKMHEDVGEKSPPNFYKMLVVGSVDGSGGSGIMAPQKEYWGIEDAYFVNLGNNYAIKPCTKCLSDTDMAQGAYTTRVKNLKFVNSNKRVDWTLKDIIWDLDGSFTGLGANSWATQYFAFNNRSSCRHMNEDDTYDKGLVCTRPIRKVKFKSMEPRELLWREMEIFGADSWEAEKQVVDSGLPPQTDRIPYRPRDFSGWAVPLQADAYYNITWNSAMRSNFREFKLEYGVPDYIEKYKEMAATTNREPKEWMGMYWQWDNWRDHFLVTVPTWYDSNKYDESWTEANTVGWDGVLGGNCAGSLGGKCTTIDAKDNESAPLVRIIGLEKKGPEGDPDLFSLYTETEKPITTLTNEMAFGTHILPGGRAHNGTFALMLNTDKIYQQGEIANLSSPFTMAIKARQCEETGCPAIEEGDWGDTRYAWSEADTWVRPGDDVDEGKHRRIEGFFEDASEFGGSNSFPKSGDPLIIPSTRWIYIDATAAGALENEIIPELDVRGRLDILITDFQDAEGGGGRNILLKAKNIRVSGMLHIDYRATDFTATIELHGNDLDKSMTPYAEDVWLGNKAVGVVGQLNLLGATTTPWAKLETTAEAGTQSIDVRSIGVLQGWAANDVLVIGSTEYDWREIEEVKITSVGDPSGPVGDTGVYVTRVNIAPALQKRHYAGVETVTDAAGNTRTVEMRAPVGKITRNVVVRGALPDGDPNKVFGGHLAVVAVAQEDVDQGVTTYRYGHIDAKYVHFENAGKQSLPWGALNFEYHLSKNDGGRDEAMEIVEGVYPNSVIGCSFSLLNYGTVLRGIHNTRIDSNVYYHGCKQTVEAWNDADRNEITNNLVVGTRRDPEDPDDWLITYASFYLAAKQTWVTGNVASGSQDTGFMIVADDCGQETVRSNEVVGAVIGVYMWPEMGAGGTGGTTGNQCKALNKWTIWKAAHFGVLVVDTGADMQLNSVTVSDSHIGISLNFVHYTKIQYAWLQDTILMGTTAASTRTDGDTCYGQTCLAFTKGDVEPNGCNSVFAGPEFVPVTGETVRRVGFMTVQKTNRAKTCVMDVGLDAGEGGMDCRPPTVPERMCSPPWERRYGVRGGIYAHVELRNTVFAKFKDECNEKAYAVAHNPSQPDYTPDMDFYQTKWIDTENGQKFRLDTRAGEGGTGCNPDDATGVCDAVQLTFGHDMDGTLLGQGTSGLFTPKESVAVIDNYPDCEDLTDMRLKFCRSLKFRWFSLYSLDPDSGSRRIPPMVMRREVANGTEKEFAAQGMGNDECAKRFYYSLVQAPLVPDREYNLTLLGTTPNSMELHYMSPDEDDKILLNIFYRDPIKRHVFRNGVERESSLALTTKPVLVNATHGTNANNPQLRRFHLVMQGGRQAEYGKNYIVIRTTTIVQLNLKLDVPLDDFTDTRRGKMINNIATLLEISADRIKIADVQPLKSRRLHDAIYEAGGRTVGSFVNGIVRRLQADGSTEVNANIEPEGGEDATPGEQENYDTVMEAQRALDTRLRDANNRTKLFNDMQEPPNEMRVLAMTSIPPSHCADGDCPPPVFSPIAAMLSNDTDEVPMQLTVTLHVDYAQDETGIRYYAIRWGDQRLSPIKDLIDLPLQHVASNIKPNYGVSKLSYTFTNEPIPPGAAYIMAFSKNIYGVSADYAFVGITDNNNGSYDVLGAGRGSSADDQLGDGLPSWAEPKKEDKGLSTEMAFLIGALCCLAVITIAAAIVYFTCFRKRAKFVAAPSKTFGETAIASAPPVKGAEVPYEQHRVSDASTENVKPLRGAPASTDEKWSDVYNRYFSWVTKQEGAAATNQPLSPKADTVGKKGDVYT